MTETARPSGQCLCGAVKFTAVPASNDMDVCHCGICRRWAGGVFMGVSCGASVEIEDDSQLGVYRSSEWAERCFCKVCGSKLFWRMRDGSNTGVSVHAFEDPGRFGFALQEFIDEKPANYDFANDTKRLTSAELFAQLDAHLARTGQESRP